MLCQICQLNTAEIKIAHLANDKKIEIHICKECAEEKGINHPLMSLPDLFGNFISELLGDDFSQKHAGQSGKKCPGCESTWEGFQETGLFGCDICYQFFEEDLKVVLRRIHGSNQHIGSRPKSFRHIVDESELVSLKSDLERAIGAEDFERAAELRDIMRDAQRELDKKANSAVLK
jgi:protein arginine kinase activator